MTKHEALQKDVAGILDITPISKSLFHYERGIGDERYEIVEFRIPSHCFYFKQEQSIILKHAPDKETKALIIAIRRNSKESTLVRCFVKGGYDALEC